MIRAKKNMTEYGSTLHKCCCSRVILVEKVMCVVPGNNKFKISVFTNLVYLKFDSKIKWPIKEIHQSPSVITKYLA